MNTVETKKEKSQLFQNFSSLTILQFINSFIPLITFPLLTRILGPNIYGMVSFAISFVSYFQFFIEFGFNISASKDTSINRENTTRISSLFTSIIIIKLFLFIFSLIMFFIIISINQKFQTDKNLYLISFGYAVSSIFNMYWLFQGLEKLNVLVFIQVFFNLIFLLLIVIIIKTQDDYYIYMLISVLCLILTGVCSTFYAISKYHLKFIKISFQEIKDDLKKALPFFINAIMVNIYTQSNTLILGLYFSDEFVGYYSGGYKIVFAVCSLIGPISQAIFPYIVKLTTRSKSETFDFIKKISIIIVIFSLILSISLFIFADLLSMIILSGAYTNSIIVIKILFLLPFIIALSNLFATQMLIPFNHQNTVLKILTITAFLNILLSILIVPIYNFIGTSICYLICETFVTISCFIAIKIKHIIPSSHQKSLD